MRINAKVHNGEYGGKQVLNETFPLVKGFSVGKNGGFITVDGAQVEGYPDREIRIKLVSKQDYEVVNFYGEEVKQEIVDNTPQAVKEELSDEERLAVKCKQGRTVYGVDMKITDGKLSSGYVSSMEDIPAP